MDSSAGMTSFRTFFDGPAAFTMVQPPDEVLCPTMLYPMVARGRGSLSIEGQQPGRYKLQR